MAPEVRLRLAAVVAQARLGKPHQARVKAAMVVMVQHQAFLAAA